MRRKASEIPSRELNIGGISVTLEYRKVKNINLYIKPPDGRVLVTAPPLADVSSIRKFLESKEAWIRKNQEKVRKAFSDVSRGEGAGKGKGAGRRISPEEQEILLARVLFYARRWEPVLKVHAKKWILREMKTRWGSCTVDTGRIWINTRLALYPEECLEYVVVHELCHLLEPGHGPGFWAYVEACLPDWRERRRILREEGGK